MTGWLTAVLIYGLLLFLLEPTRFGRWSGVRFTWTRVGFFALFYAILQVLT